MQALLRSRYGRRGSGVSSKFDKKVVEGSQQHNSREPMSDN
jgi:hypothetical protein